jgi:hypothetical protein
MLCVPLLPVPATRSPIICGAADAAVDAPAFDMLAQSRQGKVVCQQPRYCWLMLQEEGPQKKKGMDKSLVLCGHRSRVDSDSVFGL